MMTTKTDTLWIGESEVIYSYTRAQAIEDGVLVDLTEWAKETGFTIPVACTSTVWDGLIVPPEKTKRLGQSERGRAHDVLYMLYTAIKDRHNGPTDAVLFQLYFLQTPRRHKLVTLQAHCGPGDNREPVITIMLPEED